MLYLRIFGVRNSLVKGLQQYNMKIQILTAVVFALCAALPIVRDII